MQDNPFQITTSTDVGDPVPLISQDGGNHPPVTWAATSAKMILDVNGLVGDRLEAAIKLRGKATLILMKHYKNVIEREIDHLNMFVDHCDGDYDVAEIAERAVNEIREIAEGTAWQELISGAEWSASAWLTIANHLSTAIHVERLLFGDKNPDNKAAVAYKRRFTG